MEQFNRNTYKKQNAAQEFYHSCLGKMIILAILGFIAFVAAIVTTPSDAMMLQETNDNVHQCLQDNDSIKGDAIDENVSNVSRTFTQADTTLTNREVYEAYLKYNAVQVYPHTGFKTAYIHNNRHPQGVRVGIGIYGIVISTISYEDLVLDLGPARGKYNQRLIQEGAVPDEYVGENPNLKPYHYQGNPDD